MASEALGNVYPLNAGQARRRNVKPESVGVLNDCRDIAITRISAMLADTFDTIEDELFGMAEKCPDRDAQNVFLDARAQAREKRSTIEIAFRREFLSFFESKVSGNREDGADQKNGKAKINFESMSLVGDEELEQHFAMNDIAKRLNSKCDNELRTLSQRMGFLLSDPELGDDANPMAPDTIVHALQVAFDQITSGFQAKLTILRLVEDHMATEMSNLYRDINSHLVSHNVMPQLQPSFRKAASNDARRPSSAASSTANGDTSTHDRESSSRIPPPSSDLFATLQQLMAGDARSERRFTVSSGKPSAGFDGASSGAARQAEAPSGREESITGSALIAALSQIQQQVINESTTLPALRHIQDFVPGESSMAGLNVLHEIKSQGMAPAANSIDAMTIDIVAMLFDYVFDDKSVPDAIKALIARLQIPVLKVAIIDRSFFSTKSHPARRLLDMLAEASVCFDGQVRREDPLYLKIESIVDGIHSEFNTDAALFSVAIESLEAFLKEREIAGAELVEKSARAMHDHELREMARMVSGDEIDRRLATDLPPSVSAMLRGPWSRVLERVYMRENGRQAQFAKALETADDLLWSVAPKMNAADRKRLVAILPSLLKSLQTGLEIAAVEAQDRQRFFAALIDCHAAAVKAGLRGESVRTLLADGQPTAEASPLFEKLFAEEKARLPAAAPESRSGIARIQFTDHGVEMEEIEMPGPPASGTTTAPTAVVKTEATEGQIDFNVTAAPPLELKRGTWIEFLQAGGKKVRAKLTWVSPLKGVYLFTNSAASEALSVAPEALQGQLLRGEARLIEATSIIDRAVDHMVHSLSHAAS